MLAINQLCAERKLSADVVLEAVEAALISAYRRNFGAANNIEVKIEPSTGDVRVYTLKEIVETVQDPKIEVTVPEARKQMPEANLGDTLRIESTPRDFGRIAAQTAKQVILQRIREAERDAQYATFANSAGEIAHGTIQSQDLHSDDVVVALDGAEAILPAREQVPTEHYRRGTRLRAYVLDVRKGNRGPQITLSRRSPALLRRLLELEVPEIFSGTVEIKAITREAGSRSKVAVHATQDGVDPVGSCVGVRGGRIQNVVNELGGEKIDVVQWDPDVSAFIANALSPAKVMNVLLEDNPEAGKTATVIVPDRQLSLAIGKEGQNARLAAKLTGWRIDIKSATEAAEETLGRLEDIHIAPEDMDLLSLAEAYLRRKDREGPSEEERLLIQQEMEQTEATLPTWPEKEPEIEPVAEAAVSEPIEEKGAEPITLEAEEGAEPEEGATVALGEEEEEVVAARPAWLLREEEAFEPTFEGEPIEDSLGWVPVEQDIDYYSGWDEEADWAEEEEEETGPQTEWVREEFDDSADHRRAKKKKKKPRGRGLGPRYQDSNEWNPR
jgi:N utilization substance protein A